MLRTLRKLSIVKDFTQSIAFLPSLITLLMFLLGGLMWFLESRGISNRAEEILPYILFNNLETARNVLNVLTGGMISLMIFSFTMVMVVTGQAVNSLTPRVIPGFISSPGHQSVLGFYLGTIVYLLIIMISVKSNWNPYSIPSVSIIIGTLFSFICLALFVYFMHSINRTVQVDATSERLYKSTIRTLKKAKESNARIPEKADLEEPQYTFLSPRSGFLYLIDDNELLKFCKKNNCSVRMLQVPGTYVVTDSPLLKCTINLGTRENAWDLVNDFLLLREETVSESYPIHGMMLLKEIAEKALSPGINDPYSAVKIICQLGDILRVKLSVPSEVFHYAENGNYCLIKNADFTFMLNWSFDTLREYGKNNIQVISTLLSVCGNLAKAAEFDAHKYEIFRQMENIRYSADHGLSVPGDRETVNRQLAEINQVCISEIPYLRVI